MYKIISASKDTYITNKIINNKFRATDANLGQAGTLDLFKLYAENISGSDKTPTELSRILIYFDLNEVKNMQNEKKIDVGDSSFKAELCLHDIYGGQTTPDNFHIISFPLAKPFDEGKGFDVVNYTDLDSTNFITASFPAVGQAAASTATLTVSDGDDDTQSNLPAEKETIEITSADGTKKVYVFVDSEETSVATGDVLTATSDTGVSTAGDSLAGGIAIAINMTGTTSTQNNVLVQLKSAIENANGHNGKILVSAVPAAADGSQSITLTQSLTGYDGNKIIVNGLNGVTSTEFTGGVGGVQTWHIPGAMRSGSLGSSNIDVIVSGTISGQSSPINLSAEQYFQTGEEDLKLNITNFVSASVKNLITNNGFLVAFSGSYEKDNFTYFVKRFASRNTTNEAIRPKLLIKYNDALLDNHQNFEFDVSGSLYLNNFNRGNLSNIVSGSSAVQLTGEKCMILKIQTGSFSKQYDVSQALRGSANTATATISISGYADLEEGNSFTITDYLNESTKFEINLVEDTITQSSASCDLSIADHTLFTDGDTFILSASNGTGYEFTISTGTDRAGLTIDRGLFSTAEATRDAIIAAINHADASSSSDLIASSGGASSVLIKQIVAGSDGNKTNSTSLTQGDSFFTLSNFSKGYDNAIGINGLTSDAAVAEQFHDAINGHETIINSSYTATETTVTLTQPAAGVLGNKNSIDFLSGSSSVGNFTGGSFDGLEGIYSASFAISSFDDSLYDHVLASGSIEFDEIWSNHSETVTYLSSSLTVSKNNISSINFRENRYLVSMMNLKQRYKQNEYSRLRVFLENADRTIKYVKTPLEKPSEIFDNVHYQVRDFQSGNIIIPFDESNNSTKLSSDDIGMYFDFYMNSLPRGRSYIFDYLIKSNGFDVIVKDAASKFIID